jgi:hypothetical protein
VAGNRRLLNKALIEGASWDGSAVDALPLVDASIAALNASTEKYRSAFLEHRFQVRVALSDAAAIDDLHSAIAACKDAKYLKSLNVSSLGIENNMV